ncbi:restriction endonuclease subunit S [Aliarcobacter cryaerophilus]|uniref:restriction endonuclease subunit S n=1 Tax=Aliarcobacter cryaerophilus TaxID=28198 RepID=UPI0021B1913D|nr:restriction endonuclease subunit S [Aliarcobacter cryaerophilus]MCT7512666.1 restriction endonuclease subunit S [Aliarcobacter cryaerophilus]
MKSKWNKATLNDCIKIIIDYRGKTPNKLGGDWSENGYRALSAKNVKTIGGIVQEDTIRRVDNNLYNKWMKEEVMRGDILMTSEAPLGELLHWNTDEKIVLSQRLFAIRAQDYINSTYLFYYMTSSEYQHELESRATGTTVIGIKQTELIQTIIKYPSLPIQKKIAHILSTLDDKIELNRKMNQTLESMASAIFKSWFVDFDPVHAKANCEDEAELENIAKELGISKEILDLFPSEFEESELGMIPKGWEWKSFGELLTNTIGGDWGQDEADEKHTEKVRIIRGTDIPDIKNSTIQNIPVRFVESKKLATRKLFDGDIVIEISGGTKNQPTGRSLYVINEMLNVLDGEVEPASFCRLFRPINKEIGLILAQHLGYIYGIGLTWNYQNQSTGISNFQTTTFLEKEFVVVPNDEILKRFFSLVRPLIEKSFSAENITLQKTRDTLLPKLLSGEIDVSELEIK